MTSTSRIALLMAAVALPCAVVFGSYALTGGDRTPHIPEKVRIGGSPAPGTPTLQPTRPDTGHPPSPPAPPPPDTDGRGNVPPPPPVDDDADDHDDGPDDD